jgi:hypothetical protein
MHYVWMSSGGMLLRVVKLLRARVARYNKPQSKKKKRKRQNRAAVSKGQADVTLDKAQALLVESNSLVHTTGAEQLEVDVRHALTVLEERLGAGGRRQPYSVSACADLLQSALLKCYYSC